MTLSWLFYIELYNKTIEKEHCQTGANKYFEKEETMKIYSD